VIMI